MITYKSFKEQIKLYSDYDFTLLLLYSKIEIDILESEFDKFNYASILRSCGKYSEAEKIINLVDQTKIPIQNKARFFLELGFLYFEWGKNDLAKVNFKNCIENNTDSTAPFIFLSNILLEEEKVEESIQVLLKATSLKGDLDEVFYNLGTRYAILEQFEKSMDALIKCKKISPDFNNIDQLIEDIQHCLELNNTSNL